MGKKNDENSGHYVIASSLPPERLRPNDDRWNAARSCQKNGKNSKELEEGEIIEAKTRQVYDPQSREYDERKKRVTDMQECSRVFLPRPLKVTQEAQLEMRREMHSRVSEEYRQKFCDEKGKQEINLTKEEIRGIRKLEKRKQAGEIVIIMTDAHDLNYLCKRILAFQLLAPILDSLVRVSRRVGSDKVKASLPFILTSQANDLYLILEYKLDVIVLKKCSLT